MRETNPDEEKYGHKAIANNQFQHDVCRYMPVIRTLPLFAGMQKAAIEGILKCARIALYDKGAIVFLQNEQASHLYIILDGWIKIFKGNISGEESVLQMVTVGESLAETIFSSHGLYPISAQAVEKSRVLAIPASVIHEHLETNNRLALNILSIVAGRSQHMINQFEQLTLRTVTQRAGRFLLSLLLESKKRTGKITLPYDKALIAAYLGMQPETFSRVLQHFKERGIDIERDVVFLPDLFALCSYCDIELASKCPRHNTPECPLMGNIN